jgi:hypothetical protein
VIEIHDLYFKWLMDQLGDTSEPFQRLCQMLDQNVFTRRVGNDVNRASDGLHLRRRFLDAYDEANIHPRISNAFLELECSWLEMLIALSDRLDYNYDGGIKSRFLELITNLGLLKILFTSVGQSSVNIYDEVDQDLVDSATSRVDHNLIDRNGFGGLFPLRTSGHTDQREVEIWAQHAAYFSERLEEA